MDKDIAVVTSEIIEKCIYVIRGQRVMLDFDLARIYGYTTKDFNRQVKNNIHKFPDDFMFLLSDVEMENLRCKNFTSSWGGKRYAPHAFTEQGIYMLMTVLKGELAVRQSITLIRLFKQMKDYLVDNQALVGRQEFVALSNEVDGIKSDLKKVMDSFDDPSTHKEIVILNGEKFTADVAYSRIYKSAKQNIHIVDDYIGIKTLEHLQYAKKSVKITIYSDNKAGRDKLTVNLYNDFVAEYGMANIDLKKTDAKVHDRYIFIDYGTENMTVYSSGASSKDAGNKITTIIKLEAVEEFKSVIDALKKNDELVLK